MSSIQFNSNMSGVTTTPVVVNILDDLSNMEDLLPQPLVRQQADLHEISPQPNLRVVDLNDSNTSHSRFLASIPLNNHPNQWEITGYVPLAEAPIPHINTLPSDNITIDINNSDLTQVGYVTPPTLVRRITPPPVHHPSGFRTSSRMSPLRRRDSRNCYRSG
jgi:hypothetical protein